MFGEIQGTLHGPCTTMKCRFSKVKPTSTHFNRRENKWVCHWCAVEMNGRERAMKIEPANFSCITGKQYVYETLLK
jgi:hypothetical protein